jgi:TetR/AcrR family transcriptional regulator, transcriptional repressor for nem operon
LPAEREPKVTETSDRILDVAQALVQTRGYNAFSYADIAATLHVTKASLHYHFPSKATLGHSLIARYENRFRMALDIIDRKNQTAASRVQGYISIYAAVLADHRMCMCGMLAAEFETLPKPMQSALDHFFGMNELWLEAVLRDGLSDGSLRFTDEPRELAQYIVATLEGAMMMARSHADDGRFHAASRRLLAGVGV